MIGGLIALLLLSAPPTEPPALALPREDGRSAELRQTTEEFLSAIEAGDEEASRRAAERLLPELSFALDNVQSMPDDTRLTLKIMRGLALWTLGRIEEADREFFALGPAVAQEMEYLDFRLELAIEQADWPMALTLLEMNASVADPPETAFIHRFSYSSMTGFRNQLAAVAGAQTRLQELLIESDFEAGAPAGDRDYLFLWALRDRFERGDVEGARNALASIQSPEALIGLLIQEKYRALWPEIEQRHGADLGPALENIGRMLEAAKPERLDEARFRVVYGNHLKEAGSYEEIVSELGPLADDWNRVLADGEEGHWLVNIVADAEMKTDRTASAIARMTRLAEIESETEAEAGILVSMRINRLLMLLRDRQFARALADAAALAADPAGSSPYGEMWIWSAAACAAFELGDEATAARWRERLLETPEANRNAVLQAHFCADDLNAAERLLIDWLRSDAPEGALAWFQEYALERETGLWSASDGQLDALAERPAIHAEIDRVGRALTFALAE